MRAVAKTPSVALRAPETVMQLDRMGSFFPTRLSFMRSLMRDLAAGAVTVERTVWDISDAGFGRAVYQLEFEGRDYALIAFATALDPSQRTDRVIAEAWDATFVLFDGVPSVGDLDRLESEAPRQEAGRFSERELVLSRANKSVRLWADVAAALAAGQQPDPAAIQATGYLMRTTAVYGNGKFGIADRAVFADRGSMGLPFRAEMLTVWLIREFTLDLIDHVAGAMGGARAVPLAGPLRRMLGIGNSTGLGMAPFLVTHPLLLNSWMTARETALARVMAEARATPDCQAEFTELAARARRHVAAWRVADARQMARIDVVNTELPRLSDWIAEGGLEQELPWAQLWDWAAALSTETQELILSLMLEPQGALIDDLVPMMGAGDMPALDAGMSVGRLKAILATSYDWVSFDFKAPSETALFWYVSEEKLEPRLGKRHEEDGAERESPLDIARQVAALGATLNRFSDQTLVAEVLMQVPDLRALVQRVQAAPAHPFMEIRENLISERCLPIDMLRAKLSMFGAGRFDPRSDLWTRVTLYQGAPTARELDAETADDWAFPAFGD